MESFDEGYCQECGLSHEKPDRLVRLKRLLPCELREVYEAYPCTYKRRAYGDNKAQSKMLYRDLRSLRAMPVQGIWVIPKLKPRAP